ncbi:MAG: coniferyl aldehyde dehydrogenase [Gammaproteobacteria bacterium]
MAQQLQLKNITAPQTEAERILKLQKDACHAQPYPPLAVRLDLLTRLEQLLTTHADAIAAAIAADFGHRNPTETKLVEIFGSLTAIRETRKHLKRWMRPQKRKTSVLFLTGRNRVIPQPKGVIGVATPWNYPLYLSIGPVINALAAGNRSMVKLAANSQNLCRLMQQLCRDAFGDDTLAYLPDVSGSEFSSLPFDHIVYTGSAESGRNVMRAAAENLCPVTLELGGKSPTVICDDFDLREAASRLLYGKFVNAGQTCVAPDYLFVPRAKVESFVALAGEIMRQRYPDIHNSDYTSIIDRRSYVRLRETLDDAVAKGARAVNLVDGHYHEELRKIPPQLVLDVNPTMRIVQEEIFGPLLTVMPYDSLDEVLDYINAGERPLALYLFSNDRTVQERVLYQTLSGGVTINHCIFHVLQHSIPFGGVGASGMGHYHGHDGFLEMSKLRPVFTFPKVGRPELFYPPYGKSHDLLYRVLNRLGL